MKRIMVLALVLTMAVCAYADDLGFRYNTSRKGCYDQQGQGSKRGYNTGLMDRQNKFAECTKMNPQYPIHGFSHANYRMRGANMTGMDVSGSIFKFTDLLGANFTNAKLTRRMSGRMYPCDFRQALAPKARFINVWASGVRFDRALLKEANFFNSQLEGANFEYAIMNKADLSQVKAREAKFNGAKLYQASFHSANLFKAEFKDADLRKADFRKTDLFAARFDNARAADAIFSFSKGQAIPVFREADLRKANFYKTAYQQPNFSKALLMNANFQLSRHMNANFQNANLKGANFLNAVIVRVGYFSGANLERADLRNADFSKAKFKNTKVQGAIFNSRTKLPFSHKNAKKKGMIQRD